MTKSYQKIVLEVVIRSDVLLMVLDSRFPFETKNDYVESLVNKYNKQIIYVISKCDLVSKRFSEDIKRKFKKMGFDVIFVSSKKRYGSRILRTQLSILRKRMGKDKLKVGVVGYPNVGKSSLINLLKGRAVARSSLQSGFTKGKQRVRINQHISLIDTPGVLVSDDEVLLGLINAKNFDKLKKPFDVAEKIFELAKNSLKRHFKLEIDDFDTFLVVLALKFNKKSKGNEPDLDYSARRIVKDWQIGKISI